jgi:hypothetical protein
MKTFPPAGLVVGSGTWTGASLGVELGGRVVLMWSSRPAAALGLALPLRLRTYATISQTWYSGMRPRKEGMPLGRPSMIDVKTWSGAPP